MPIDIPRPRQADANCSVADIILEQSLIAEGTINVIRKVARFRGDREVRDEVNRRLRECHSFLRMRGERDRRSGHLYLQKGIDSRPRSTDTLTAEHVIPVTRLVDKFLADELDFISLVFCPVALITKEADVALRRAGRVAGGECFSRPFVRYCGLGFGIVTHEGCCVDLENWSMCDHEKLIERTPIVRDIREEVRRKRIETVKEVLHMG